MNERLTPRFVNEIRYIILTSMNSSLFLHFQMLYDNNYIFLFIKDQTSYSTKYNDIIIIIIITRWWTNHYTTCIYYQYYNPIGNALNTVASFFSQLVKLDQPGLQFQDMFEVCMSIDWNPYWYWNEAFVF